MANIWKTFEGLLPNDSLTLGTVQTVNSDGTSTVELLDGARVRVVGQSVAAGNKCYMRRGEIVQAAPNLPQSNMILY